ncbi:hypothetical protein COOONC_00723 [Cooperia oncophora]
MFSFSFKKGTKRKLCEQTLSLIRRLNESSWRSHPVLLPFSLFYDYKTVQKGGKKNTYNCDYPLTEEDLRGEKVTVHVDDDYGTAQEKISSDGATLTDLQKAAEQKRQTIEDQSETTSTNPTEKVSKVADPLVEKFGKQMPVQEQPAISLPWQFIDMFPQVELSESNAQLDEEDEGDEYLD